MSSPKSSREVAAHPLAEKFFPAVTILGLGGVGVLFLQRGEVGIALLAGGVNAGRRRVEKALDAVLLGRHQHVGVDQNREHAERPVVLDKAHAAHVGGEIVDQRRAFERFFAGFLFAEIEHDIFDIVELLVPLAQGLDVDGANRPEALPPQIGHEMPADKPARSADHDFLLCAHKVKGCLKNEEK